MIYARDKGQMCNNLLQYGHVYAFGREHGRKTISLRFAYKYPFFKISTTEGHNFFRYALVKYAAKAGLIPVVKFDTPGEDCRLREKEILEPRNVIVEGWEVRFYDLFIKYLDEIKALFSFTKGVENYADRFLKRSEGRLRIGLHIRRGDYARWQGGKYFFYDRQYIEVANKIISLFPERDISLIVCSNEPEPDKTSFREGINGAEVEFSDGSAGEDLCLLSKCDLLAGPPSTFSLVASMYHDTPLYRILDPDAPVSPESFGHFNELFRQII